MYDLTSLLDDEVVEKEKTELEELKSIIDDATSKKKKKKKKKHKK